MVEQALRCRPDAPFPCAVLDDGLGPVESAHPRLEVLEVLRTGDQIRSSVLRQASWTSESLLFEYEHGPDGKVLGRTCFSTIPEEGAALQTARRPDEYLQDRVVFHDRCTLEGPCRSRVKRRVSFLVDGAARLRQPREEGPLRLSERADSPDCLFFPHDVPLPSGRVEVLSFTGQAWQQGEGEALPLRKGADVREQQIFLFPGSSLHLQAQGKTLRFDADQDKGTRLRFRQDEVLVGGWEASDGLLQPTPLHWSPPYLYDGATLVRLGKEGATPVCRAMLSRICEKACEGFRAGVGPIATERLVLLPGPGAIRAGACFKRH